MDTNTGDVYPYAEFSVKKWEQNQIIPRTFVMSEADMLGMPLDTEFSLILTNGNPIPWTEENGAEGQGYNDPKSEHTNHAIVEYDNKYFDPSYGSPERNTKEIWENEALNFFQTYLRYTTELNGIETEMRISWIAESNTSMLQTRFLH